MASGCRVVTVLILLASVCIGLFFHFQPRVQIPIHLLNHPAFFQENLLSAQKGAELLALVKEMAVFPTNAADLKFYKTKHEHIGEARPIGSNGQCDHPYLIPSPDKTQCILPGRIDVGRHYLLHGGVVGLKETYEHLISRVLSFGRYMFDFQQYDAVRELFADKTFLTLARNVCPADKQVLDPFQFNFILQIPGQTVALHIDAPYFWGASRFQFPQWLLAAMTFSGRFKDQVQIVAYLHQWNDSRDGGFIYWNTDDLVGKTVPPLPLAGSSVDGSKVVHAAMVYQPKGYTMPVLKKDNENVLRHLGDDKWELSSNGKVIASYTTDDLRISVVYRARCFTNKQEITKYYNLPEDDHMTLEYILSSLSDELVDRGKVSKQKLRNMSRLDLGLLIQDEFITYPLPLRDYALIPYNYCMLSKLVPFTKHVLQFFCT